VKFGFAGRQAFLSDREFLSISASSKLALSRHSLHPHNFVFGDRVLFQFDDVSKTYGNIRALDSLTVAVPIGAIGLLGPNGSGKTTLIRTLLGLITADRGSGEVLGLDFRRRQLDIRRLVGFAPEDECLFPRVVGVEFVAYAGELVGMSRVDSLQRAHEVLDYVGLGEARYRPAESYSTGMKQRLKLASAIVHDPQLLILDEPTNGMDPAGRVEVLELARDLAHNKGMSLLFSSHLLPDVESVCDHVIVLGSGKLLAQGKIDELKQVHDQCFDVRLKSDSHQFAARLSELGCSIQPQEDLLRVRIPAGRNPQILWQLAAEHNEQIRYLRPQRSTLEEVFLNAVGSDGRGNS
jgi:ABC-2 type transport system ATP-binding protein